MEVTSARGLTKSKRPVIFILLILVCLPIYLRHRSAAASNVCIEELLVRSETQVIDLAASEEQLARFSHSPLIRALQLIHVGEYQHYLPNQSPAQGIRRKTFYPFWVFDSYEAMELLLTSFPDGYQISPLGRERNFYGIEAFVDQWASDFERAGGTISPLWITGRHESGKKRFIKRLVLSLATWHQYALNIDVEAQPVRFTRRQRDVFSLLAGFVSITDLFGNVQATFNVVFEDFARKSKALRIPRVPYPPQDKYLAILRTMQQLDLRTKAKRTPLRREYDRLQERKHYLDLTLENMQSLGEKRLPLAAIFQLSSDSAGIAQHEMLFPEAEKILDLFGSFATFIAYLNEQLGEEGITLGEHANNWSQEILIQTTAYHVIEIGARDTFSGFQTTEPEEALYLNPGSTLFVNSRMSLTQLNTAVAARLESLHHKP